MLCFVYKSRKKSDTYLFVKTKDDFNDVPKTLRQMLGPLEFVMEVDLAARQTLARVEPRQVRELLETQGYYLQLPPTTEFYSV